MKPPLKGLSYSDDFQTPAVALRPLLGFLRKNWTIWECAAGRGNLVKGLESEGLKVIATDILTGYDFLKWQPDEYDCIVTNPPYSLKERFLYRCYDLKKPFALLLPLTALETAKRQKLYQKHGLELILFDKRIDFEVPSGKESKSWFATAWFTNWLSIGKELNWASVLRHKQLELWP